MLSEKWEMNTTINVLVGAVITPNDVIEKPSSIILLKKYSNFSDVFDKICADKLPRYSKHDLAIETEKGKQLPFGPTYNYFQLELEMLNKYIDKILEKKFIVLSKLPTGAPILFTKKKTGGLCLCIDLGA